MDYVDGGSDVVIVGGVGCNGGGGGSWWLQSSFNTSVKTFMVGLVSQGSISFKNSFLRITLFE